MISSSLLRLSVCALLAVPLLSQAEDNPIPSDRVIYQTTVEQWVTTASAKVVVNINASVDKDGLVAMRQRVTANLQKIADAEWSITRFDRSTDPSGLEKVDVAAEARVAEKELLGMKEVALKVSRPGVNYQIVTIDFTPTLAETEVVKARLREKIYVQVNEELQRVNKIYAPQTFQVRMVNFTNGSSPIQPMYKNAAQGEMRAMAYAGGDANLSVGSKSTVTAWVELALKPEK